MTFCKSIPESELVTVNDEGETHSPFDKLVDPAPDALRAAVAKEKLLRISGMFKDDDDAILVLEAWYRDGWKREDFINVGMSPSDYDAAVKRIHYRVRNERQDAKR